MAPGGARQEGNSSGRSRGGAVRQGHGMKAGRSKGVWHARLHMLARPPMPAPRAVIARVSRPQDPQLPWAAQEER